ncbi:dynein assembly factor with WDR repeat domains 1 isoform X2 [Neovison vison]|uniref:dynein assembly factor with WDR repeat domains 1 isoform X2 n=1 Tax=Neovison vison TaxID=452646 RepID=UPI001CF0AD1D|nr:dynein assembly factor with WDR repeat domains 1 isoform X2 [Neogale vison]
MKLKGLLLRYYPPGIMLEYEKSGELRTKSIDLLNLSSSTDVNALVEEIQKAEPLITASRSDLVKLLIQRLQDKLRQHSNHKFYLFKVLRAHILPLTNVALNKSGSCFITGSYDRTCKVWDTASGEELHTLEGHRNVVYAIAFNNPYGDKIATGSFDKTCKLWSVETGKCYHTFRGHTAEIVCLSFNPQSTLVATGSMDTTAKLWDIQSGEEVFTLTGHSAEIISLSFNTSGKRIITGSFDHTVAVWEADTGRKVYTLIGHCAEISSALSNWDCSLIVTGSMDKTCMLWDATNGKCVATLTGHDDEILDSCFDYTGKLIATASADGVCTGLHHLTDNYGLVVQYMYLSSLKTTDDAPIPLCHFPVDHVCYSIMPTLSLQDTCSIYSRPGSPNEILLYVPSSS